MLPYSSPNPRSSRWNRPHRHTCLRDALSGRAPIGDQRCASKRAGRLGAMRSLVGRAVMVGFVLRGTCDDAHDGRRHTRPFRSARGTETETGRRQRDQMWWIHVSLSTSPPTSYLS